MPTGQVAHCRLACQILASARSDTAAGSSALLRAVNVDVAERTAPDRDGCGDLEELRVHDSAAVTRRRHRQLHAAVMGDRSSRHCSRHPGSGRVAQCARESVESRLRVRALGLNRAEAMFRSGTYLETPNPPAKLGYEAAGEIEAIGEGVTGFSVGDAVSTIPAFSMSQIRRLRGYRDRARPCRGQASD